MRRGKTYEWLPLWRNKWLMGSTRWELDPAERGVFIDLLCLAGGDDGFIRANPTTPYPLHYLAGMFQAPLELVQRTVEKCIIVGKIHRLEDGILYINSWDDYKLYPRRKRELMEGTPAGTPSSHKQDNVSKQEEMHTLNDTERSAGCGTEIRRVLGGNEKAALDKAVDKARTGAAKLSAELKGKIERGER
jgi:hypothetical protein